MRCRSLVALAIVTLAPAPLRGDQPSEGSVTTWSDRIEFVRQLLQDQPVRVVRDHVVALGSGSASLTFNFEGGGGLRLGVEDGTARIDGRVIGRAPAGGAFEAAWQQLVLAAGRQTSSGALQLLHDWHPDGLSRDEERLLSQFTEQAAALSAPAGTPAAPQVVTRADPGGLSIDLRDLSDPARLAPLLYAAASLRGPSLRVTVPDGLAHVGHFSVGSAETVRGPVLVIRGDADIFGRVEGNVAAVEGSVIVHPGGIIAGDALALAGEVRDVGGDIEGQIRTVGPSRRGAAGAAISGPAAPLSAWGRLARNAAGVAGVLATLLLLGFGLVLFARPPLEVVSDTVLHSFSRSLLVGLLGQVLLLPTFGMLVVGLVLSVAGILLVPFAIIVFALLLVLAVLGGFLATAHAMGERVTRRQLAMGLSITSANSYRYVAVGLGGIAVLWLAWVLFGWVPLAGTLVLVAAALATWLLATVGFGATLLSRAGLREHFAGRLLPAEALTDEYLWATPQFGVSAVARPGKHRTPPPE